MSRRTRQVRRRQRILQAAGETASTEVREQLRNHLVAARVLMATESSTSDHPVSKALKVMVCVDEAHKLCGDDTITSLIKEARKYGLGIILSSQETRDFHPSIFANTGTLICLALEDVDATKMSQQLGITDKAQQKIAKDLILSQENGRALIRSQHFLPYAQVQIKSFEDRAMS